MEESPARVAALLMVNKVEGTFHGISRPRRDRCWSDPQWLLQS
jgi:hypothetical protein